MRRFANRTAITAPLGLLLCTVAVQGQQPGKLLVRGAGLQTVTFTAADFEKLPRLSVEVHNSHSGQTERYEGVRLSELLEKAGVPLGDKLKGSALATYVVARAADGYAVVYSVAELDPAMNGNEIIVADAMNGKPLSQRQGPFEVIVPTDKRPARWIRMVDEFEVQGATPSPGASHPWDTGCR